MTDELWGPWTEHDGAMPDLPRGGIVIEISSVLPGITLKAGDRATLEHPGWYWRWKRVRCGWFRRELRRVCDDPSYAPIIAYRIRRYPAATKLIESVRERQSA